MTTTVLDPTAETAPAARELSQRLDTFEGKTVGLLDISKPRGDVFLNHVQAKLEDLGMRVERFRKPTFSKPAPVDLRHEIATSCEAVIEALAD